ncbi:MAG: SbcC/MukB-like Walker B domain-containing protein, partial [Clostridia bacterium]
KQKEFDDLKDMLPEELKKLNPEHISAELERIEKHDKEIEKLRSQIENQEKELESVRKSIGQLAESKQELDIKYNEVEMEGKGLREQKIEKEIKLKELTGDKNIEKELKEIDVLIKRLQESKQGFAEQLKEMQNRFQQVSTQKSTLENQQEIYRDNFREETSRLDVLLQEKDFVSAEEAETCMLSKEQQQILQDKIENYEKIHKQLHIQKAAVEEKLKGRNLTQDEWEQINDTYASKKQEKEESISIYENAKNIYNNIKNNFDKWIQASTERQQLSNKREMLEQIQKLLKGNSFIEFICEERLRYVASEASETLGMLSKYKYALEVDSENGFVIRDNGNGGVYRMITSLSGGEIFLTSLSLALALSSQIQLKGQSPLEFFFLDEGFGTLDNQLLDTVIDSLEKLSTSKRVIGLISHVPELKSRICRRLVVEPPTSFGQGSRIIIEKA